MLRVRIDLLGALKATFPRSLIYRFCIRLLSMKPMTEYQNSSTGYEDDKSNHTDSERSTTCSQSLIMFIALVISKLLKS
jgi:hypothetical protein